MSMQGVPGRRPTARGRTPRQATQPPHIYSRILGRRNVYVERPGSTVPSKSPHGGGRPGLRNVRAALGRPSQGVLVATGAPVAPPLRGFTLGWQPADERRRRRGAALPAPEGFAPLQAPHRQDLVGLGRQAPQGRLAVCAQSDEQYICPRSQALQTNVCARQRWHRKNRPTGSNGVLHQAVEPGQECLLRGILAAHTCLAECGGTVPE